MKTRGSLSRRSFLGRVVGGAVVGGGALVALSTTAAGGQINDSDPYGVTAPEHILEVVGKQVETAGAA